MGEFFQSFSAGIIQGTTEFLPVSSSGHLFLFRNFFNIDFGTDYVVLLHFGTLLAVLFFFWKDIWQIIHGLFTKNFYSWKLFFALIIGTIPAAVSGLLIEEFLEQHLTSNLTIGISLIITGVFLFFSDYLKKTDYSIKQIGMKKAFFIGIFQALAIIPGLSRSGLTLFGALLLGVKREDAFKFSFLLSIPVILGSTILKMGQISQSAQGLLGFVVAAISGFFALWLLKILTRTKKLKYFAFYCWIMGILVLV
ncbi:MAG: undecaprenyl-diphosphate phosphatase [Thermotogota bacterium]|nr:undecaprenyl-diphosphate phosphatase [Thermotogota bacterium]